MNILVFSDTHLYLPFDGKKFNFLKKIISDSDQVIINGDFFDDYMISFDEFIKSPWNQLFPLLKKKKAIYIFGNHDQEKFSDKRTEQFSDSQKIRYKLIINKIFMKCKRCYCNYSLFFSFFKLLQNKVLYFIIIY